MDRALAHPAQTEYPEYPPRGTPHYEDQRPGQGQPDIHRRGYGQGHLLCPLQGEGLRHQFAEDDVHEGDQTKSDTDGDAMGVDKEVRDTLQKLEALNEMGDHRLADPAQGKADHGDAELHTVYDFVQVAVQSLQNASAYAARSDELLDAGLTDRDQRKFGSGKKSIGRYQGYDE